MTVLLDCACERYPLKAADEIRALRVELGRFENAVEDALGLYEDTGSAPEMYRRLLEAIHDRSA